MQHMEMAILISYFLLTGFVWMSVATDTCTFQICFCEQNEISCQDLGLTEIPPISGPIPDLAELMFDTNNITAIPAGSLPMRLTRFTAFDNPIAFIDDSAFNESYSTLETIQLSTFLFTRIPDAFLHFKTLKYLTMFDISILDWNEAVMKQIGPTMLTLDLQNVGLLAWPSWIQYFTNLTELSLSSGSISSIPDDALDMLANKLTTLSLGQNNLTTIPKTVSKMNALKMLEIQNNQITYLAWLPPVNTLSSLALDNNKLPDAKHVSDALRPFADSLYEVTLTGNELTEFPDLSFLKMMNGLDFSHNRISDPNSGAFSDDIYNLKLDYNSLTQIPVIMFRLSFVSELRMSSNAVAEVIGTQFPSWITVVDLSFNLITELTDTSFPINSSITSLYLMNNPLSTFSVHAFDNVRMLNVLNLQNTKLTRLPLGLASLVYVNDFDVTGCSDLVCTCMEKSLAPWILTRTSEAGGKCGEASISDFFTTLIRSCPKMK